MKQKRRHKIYHGTQLGKPQILLLTAKCFFYKLHMLEDVFFLLCSTPTDQDAPTPYLPSPTSRRLQPSLVSVLN